MLEFQLKWDKKDEFVKVIKNEVLPILKKQTGFLEILPFFPEMTTEKVISITLWTEKKHLERYEREVFPKVEEMVRPYLSSPIAVHFYNLETTLCEHFVQSLAA
jgi:hypothetical protein